MVTPAKVQAAQRAIQVLIDAGLVKPSYQILLAQMFRAIHKRVANDANK